VNFSPAVSRDALKTMRQTIRGWHLQLKSDKSLADLSAMFAPILKGWQQYCGHFHGSALKPVWRNMNLFLLRWLMRKHKTLAGHKTRAAETLKRLAQNQPRLIAYRHRLIQRRRDAYSWRTLGVTVYDRSAASRCNRGRRTVLAFGGDFSVRAKHDRD